MRGTIHRNVLGIRIEENGVFCHVDVQALRGAFICAVTCSDKGSRVFTSGLAAVDVRPARLAVKEITADADRE